MNIHRFFPIRILILLSITILSACGGTPAATQSSATEPAASSACPQPSPKMEVTSKEVNLFTWAEYIPQQALDCFEEVYGVKVNIDNFSSIEEMYAKLSKGASGYDIVQPGDYIVELMVKDGMLEKFDAGKLSVMSNFGAQYLDKPFDPGNQYTLPYQVGSTAIAYNADTVKTIPTSYADMWNKEYAGHLVMVDDSRSIIGMTLLTLGYDVSSTDPKQLAEAKAKLAELVPNVRVFDSDSPKNVLIGGEADLGLIWGSEAFLAHAEKPSIKYVYPTEGAILWQDNFSIMSGAPHNDAAYAFLNYFYQADIFWMVMRDYPNTNPNTAAIEYAKINQPDVYKKYMASNITNMSSEDVTNGHWLKDLGDAAAIFDKVWVEVKGP